MAQDLRVDLYDEELDPADVEQLTLLLRQELLELDDVEEVTAAAAGPAPPGSRALELAAIGALIVSARPTAEAIAKVVGVLHDWLRRRKSSQAAPQSTLRITANGETLELTPTRTEQAALVEEFIRRARAAQPPAAAPS
jgi:hypothetical protein